jgi:hypothetical protein
VLDSLKVPGEEPLSFVYLSETPYTGLDLGPWGTALYWIMLIGWSAAAAYLVLFTALPFAAARVKSFGGSVKTALNKEPVVAHAAPHHAPAPVHHSAHPPAPARPVGYNVHDGFRSFAAGDGLTIDDIVKGLSRQIEEKHVAAPVYVQETARTPEPVREAPVAPTRPIEAPASIPEGVHDFIKALLDGDRDTVFGTVRKVTREGGSTEEFVSHAVCALDDAYRARIDGTTCHPDIASLTADCHPSFLERLVSSLTTAVDGSYSTGLTGVKLALTRALGVVQG